MSHRTKIVLTTLCLLSALNAVALVLKFVVARQSRRSRNELPGFDARSRFHAGGQGNRRAMQRQRRHRQAEVPRGIIPVAVIVLTSSYFPAARVRIAVINWDAVWLETTACLLSSR
jgi:hypothetical protein